MEAVCSPPGRVWAQETEDLKEKEKPYSVVFKGNNGLSNIALQRAAAEELRAFDRKGPLRSDVDDAAFQMELAYRKAGYPFASVEYKIEEIEGKPQISFIVKEGTRVTLKEIVITGNKAIDTKKLLPFFEGEKAAFFHQGRLLFVKSEIESALSQIRDFYISNGYHDVSIGEPHYVYNKDRTEAVITFSINEGTHYTIRDVLFQGDVITDAEKDMKKLREALIGKPYFARRKQSLRNGLAEIYGNLGYPKPKIDVADNQGSQPGSMVLVAEISKGPQVTISEIIIKGNQKTRAEFIRNRLSLKPGDRFDLKKQRESFRALYRTGLFSKVDLNLEERATTDSWPLVIDVKELPTRELYFEPGWGSYEKLRLRAGFRQNNLLGTGRAFGAEGAASFKAQSVQLTLSDPWFLNTDISADLPVYYSRREEPSFTREDKGTSILFKRKLTDNLTGIAGYGFRMTDLSDVDPYEEYPVDDYDLGSVKLQTTYDTRNDLFFPTRGKWGFISIEHADEILGGKITFTRLTGGIRYFVSLAKDTVLALRYRTGLIIPGSDFVTVPVGEKFFNGGENTVRSFRQSKLGPRDPFGRPTGGLAVNIFNIELRQRLIGNLVGTVFFDFGNISPNQTRIQQGLPPYASRSEIMSDTLNQYFRDFRPGIGVGLQYLLPVGPARIDFAFNPDRNKDLGEELFVIHFSVGMAF